MNERARRFVQVLGVMLVLLGIIALVGQALQWRLQAILWPFFIIVPGVLLFLFATGIEGGLGEPLAMVSGIITGVGLLLLYQSLTGHWASWAYAWALVAPTSVGVGQILYGWLAARQSAVRSGASLTRIGLIIFVVGLIFFELILNISGFGLGFIGWPILFIGLGIYVLARGLLKK